MTLERIGLQQQFPQQLTSKHFESSLLQKTGDTRRLFRAGKCLELQSVIWLRKIVDINMELFGNATTMTPSHIPGRQDGHISLADELETKDFAIDTAFQLSKDLIDILSKVRRRLGENLRSHAAQCGEVVSYLRDHNCTSRATVVLPSRIDDAGASNGKTNACSLAISSTLLMYSSCVRISICPVQILA